MKANYPKHFEEIAKCLQKSSHLRVYTRKHEDWSRDINCKTGAKTNCAGVVNGPWEVRGSFLQDVIKETQDLRLIERSNIGSVSRLKCKKGKAISDHHVKGCQTDHESS